MMMIWLGVIIRKMLLPTLEEVFLLKSLNYSIVLSTIHLGTLSREIQEPRIMETGDIYYFSQIEGIKQSSPLVLMQKEPVHNPGGSYSCTLCEVILQQEHAVCV